MIFFALRINTLSRKAFHLCKLTHLILTPSTTSLLLSTDLQQKFRRWIITTSIIRSNADESRSSSGSGEHAALWAAIAYAKFQHRAINNIPRALGPVGEMVWTAERMYAQARSLIPNEEGVLELGE